MTNKEAIRFLQQLYPNGGHCWLDEQRIEAIGMAVKALQKEPVSEDLEQAVNAYIGYAPEVDESSSTYGKRQAFKAGANWQKQKDSIPVSEDLEQAAFDNAQKNYKEGFRGAAMQAFNEGVLWQKQQMMAKAVKVNISNASIVSLPLDCNLKVGDKVLLIKE